MKKSLVLHLTLLIAALGCLDAQNMRPYVVKGVDTVHCKTISFGYSRRGLLEYAEYVDTKGNKIRTESEEGLPGVTTIFVEDTTFDRVPIDPGKADGPVWYAPRMADGKIKLYLIDATYYYSTANDVGGYYRFTFQMPDGKFYKVTQGNVNKYVKPYVQQCANFVNRYKGNYKADQNEFYQLVTIYNAQCK